MPGACRPSPFAQRHPAGWPGARPLSCRVRAIRGDRRPPASGLMGRRDRPGLEARQCRDVADTTDTTDAASPPILGPERDPMRSWRGAMPFSRGCIADLYLETPRSQGHRRGGLLAALLAGVMALAHPDALAGDAGAGDVGRRRRANHAPDLPRPRRQRQGAARRQGPTVRRRQRMGGRRNLVRRRAIRSASSSSPKASRACSRPCVFLAPRPAARPCRRAGSAGWSCRPA